MEKSSTHKIPGSIEELLMDSTQLDFDKLLTLAEQLIDNETAAVLIKDRYPKGISIQDNEKISGALLRRHLVMFVLVITIKNSPHFQALRKMLWSEIEHGYQHQTKQGLVKINYGIRTRVMPEGEMEYVVVDFKSNELVDEEEDW